MNEIRLLGGMLDRVRWPSATKKPEDSDPSSGPETGSSKPAGADSVPGSKSCPEAITPELDLNVRPPSDTDSWTASVIVSSQDACEGQTSSSDPGESGDFKDFPASQETPNCGGSGPKPETPTRFQPLAPVGVPIQNSFGQKSPHHIQGSDPKPKPESYTHCGQTQFQPGLVTPVGIPISNNFGQKIPNHIQGSDHKPESYTHCSQTQFQPRLVSSVGVPMFSSFGQKSPTRCQGSERVVTGCPAPPGVASGSSHNPNVLVVEKEYDPQAIYDLFVLETSESSRGKSAGLAKLRMKVRKHLSYLGWVFWYKDKKGKKELRYSSPGGQCYYSLRTACKAAMEDGGGARTPMQGDFRP